MATLTSPGKLLALIGKIVLHGGPQDPILVGLLHALTDDTIFQSFVKLNDPATKDKLPVILAIGENLFEDLTTNGGTTTENTNTENNPS